jgi:small multidrug resistance family-3 protein
MFKTFVLFFITAIFEILGCYFIMKALHDSGSFLSGQFFSYVIGSISCLVVFGILLTIHPTDSGRVFAAYGGVYILASLIWLRVIDGVSLTPLDLFGGALSITGAIIIMLSWNK